MTCPHSETTPEDGEGRAICTACGALILVRMTPKILDQAMKAILRRGREL